MTDKALAMNSVIFQKYLFFIFVVIATLSATGILYTLSRRILDSRLQERHSKFIARLLQIAMTVLGFYAGIYYVLQLDLKALAASLGIISVAIAFSSQQMIQNIIAGILISIRRPIWFEDWVEISNSGVSRVKDIMLTQTLLRSIDGRLFYFPNASLLSTNIINYTKSGFVRVDIPVSFAFDIDVEAVSKLMMDVAGQTPQILPKVSSLEIKQVKQKFHLLHLKNFFEDVPERTRFMPVVVLGDISGGKVTLVMKCWIQEIRFKNEITSNYLKSLHVLLKQRSLRTA